MIPKIQTSMHLGKILSFSLTLLAILMIPACGTGKEYTDYAAAKELFKVGMEKSTVIEVFGEPNNTLDSETLTTWFYEHEAIVKDLQIGETREAFLINFENGKTVGIDPIIVTRR